jgi:DNA-directed RNA polymerase specialized sigma24 family protein
MPTHHARRYRVRPLSAELADEVRATRRSPDYSHPVHAEIAGGSAPCRVCLERFLPGEDRRLLLTYDPFREVATELPLPGPVFIHEEHCSPWQGDGLPARLVDDRLTFIAYATAGQWLTRCGRRAPVTCSRRSSSSRCSRPSTSTCARRLQAASSSSSIATQAEDDRAPDHMPAPFQIVYDRFAADIWRFCASQVGAERADACFQETMLAALTAYPSLRDSEAARPWLFQIAARKAIDIHRAARREAPVPEIVDAGTEVAHEVADDGPVKTPCGVCQASSAQPWRTASSRTSPIARSVT